MDINKENYKTIYFLSKALFINNSKIWNFIDLNKGLEKILRNPDGVKQKIRIGSTENYRNNISNYLNLFDDDESFISQVFWTLKILYEEKLIRDFRKAQSNSKIIKKISNLVVEARYKNFLNEIPNYNSFSEKAEHIGELYYRFDLTIKKNNLIIFKAMNVDINTSCFVLEGVFENGVLKYENLNLYKKYLEPIKVCSITKGERKEIIKSLKNDLKDFSYEIINETQKIEDELLVELNNTKKEKNKRENQLIRGFEKAVKDDILEDKAKDKLIKKEKKELEEQINKRNTFIRKCIIILFIVFILLILKN